MHSRRPHRRRHRPHLIAATVLALALAGVTWPASPPAHAVTASDSSTDTSSEVQDGTQLSTSDEQALTTASAAAESTGTTQAVSTLFTPTEQIYATPTGDFTLTSSALPMQVRSHNGWVSTDPTLVTTSAGATLAPKASYDSLTLSNGSSTTVATMTVHGTLLGVGWPTTLPVPTLNGATAVYPEVMPGIDLDVTADEVGDVSEVLVVKNAAAASDPALASIAMPTTAEGLSVSADAYGNLTAATPAAQAQFSAAAPQMWDSATGSDPVTSGIDGPGTGANTAAVADSVDSTGTVTVTPAQSMLTASTTVYPVYVSTLAWHAHWANGPEQAFDEVQQGCSNTSNYDSTTYDKQGLGVGDNAFWGCLGTERAYYRFGVPVSQLANAQIISATLNATVSFAAAKGTNTDTLNVYSTCGISGATTWNHQPCHDATANPNYPNPLTSASVTTTSQFPGKALGFNVARGLTTAVGKGWTTWTMEIANATESNSTDFVRLAKNPNITVEFDHPPGKPWGLGAVDGSANTGCVTSAPYPWMGKTASVTPPTLQAYVSDLDGDQLQANFHYWIDGTSTGGTVSSVVASGQQARAAEPASFVNALATGQTVDWQVQASDGHASGPWSPVCHYTIDKTAPDEPTVTSSTYPPLTSGSTPPPAGTPGTFTIQAALGTATSMTFVYGLDSPPPTANAPASHILTAAKLAVGTGYVWNASLPLAAPNPGPHNLYVYSVDQAGNTSGEFVYEFLAAGDTPVSCASLSACFNNTITSADTNKAAADGDGGGHSISTTDLANAGWPTAGGTVTVDGAPITLPAYGTGAGDNVLAKGQTIALPEGTLGSALVILATASNANVVAGPVATTSIPANAAAPILAAGSPVVGQYDATHRTTVYPTGWVGYAAGGSKTYALTVPDWVTGPTGPAVVSLPHTNQASGQLAKPIQLYAFTIPLSASDTIASVTLPDISPTVSGGTPALHVLGIGVRPLRNWDLPAGAPTGSYWTGAWSAAPAGMHSVAAGYWSPNQTVRTELTPSVSGAGIKVRISNAGNTAPLVIGTATAASQAAAGSPAAASAPVPVTFGNGSRSVTIPAGAEAWSDPLTMNVTGGSPLLLSMSVGAKITNVAGQSFNGDTTSWLTAADGIDHTGDTAATAFTGSGGAWTDMLTDVAVATPTSATTVAVLGDNVVNPWSTGSTVSSGTARIADDLRGTAGTASFVDEGLPNNQVLTDAVPHSGGPALLSRIDRDVLEQPGIGTVVIDEGMAELLNGLSPAGEPTNALGELQQLLTSWGVSVVIATPTPCGGYAPCTATVESERQDLIKWVENNTFAWGGPYEADFSTAVANTATTPPSLQSAYDQGDHVNLSPAGYQQLAATILPGWVRANPLH